MIRTGVLSLLLLTCFGLSAAYPQVPGFGAPIEEVAPPETLAAFGSHEIPGEHVVELADFIVSYLADSHSAPDWAQVRTSDGALRRLSIADTFSLLARTTYLWQALGRLPDSVPIAPTGLRAPVIDPQDVVTRGEDPSVAREIPTDPFLAQCAATVQWIDRLRIVPTAVWVEGERLSATEYLAGLAVCIQYAYYQGSLEAYLILPRYGPPQAWSQTTARAPLSTRSAPTLALPPAQPEAAETAGGLLPAEGQGAPEEHPAPRVALYPEPGTELSGPVNLVVAYQGPPARFIMFHIDGIKRAITNLPPYSCRWDTTAETPGPHAVRVTVLGEDAAVLTSLIGGFTVAPPEPETAEAELSDVF